jgi:hypothetical protein
VAIACGFLVTFLCCLIGTAGVVTVVGILVLVDVFVGLARSDVAARMRRPRW